MFNKMIEEMHEVCFLHSARGVCSSFAARWSIDEEVIVEVHPREYDVGRNIVPCS